MNLAGAIRANGNRLDWPETQLRAFLTQAKETGSDALPLLGVSVATGVRQRWDGDGRPAASSDLSAYKLVRPGDIVMNALGKPHGSIGMSPIEGITSPAYWVMRVGKVADGRFVHYLLRSSHLLAEYQRLGKNQPPNQFDISWTDFRRITLPLPNVSTQRAIAGYLDRETARIDTLIEEQQLLIKMLGERRHAAVEAAVSVVPTSGARLKHIICSVRQGWSPQCYSWPASGTDEWAVLKTGAANGGRFRPWENKALPEDETPRPDIAVAHGDLVVSRANTRDLVGSAAVVDGEFPRLMLCDKLYAFTLDENRADPRFVAVVLGSRRWRDLIELEASGASHSMLNISQSDIVNLPMPLPPVEVQRQITARLNAELVRVDALIAETERFVELSRERRSAVIMAAVTGQIEACEAA